MKSYKREYFILAAVVVSVFIGFYNVLKIKEPNMVELKEKILNSSDLAHMAEGNLQRLRKLYYINKSEIEDFIFFAPKTNMDANEILIIKAKSQDGLTEVRNKVEERLEKSSNSFESYRPDQYELIKNKILQTKGNYLVLIVAEDAKELEKLINKEF